MKATCSKCGNTEQVTTREIRGEWYGIDGEIWENDSAADTWTCPECQGNQDQWWKFGGDNLQARYGYGTHAQALEYAAYLNRNREINQFFIMDADRPDSDLCDEWPDLGEELAAIADIDEAAQ